MQTQLKAAAPTQRLRARMLPRILCVDDEPMVLEGLVDNLRRHFEVVTASSPSMGLELLSSAGPFAVVMSDFQMPEMNGAEFLSHVRLVAPETVRVLLTGQASMDGAIEAVNEGNIYRFLTKPCEPGQLIRVLEDAVEQARLVTNDRLLMERKLETMSGHLLRAERLATLGTLAGAVAHELKNMLVMLGSASEVISEDVAANRVPDQEEVDLLKQVYERLKKNAHNLMHLGKPAGGSAGVQDLGALMQESVSMMRTAGVLKFSEVKFSLPDEKVRAPIGALELEQVVVNLMKNAHDAMTDAGRRDPMIEVKLSLDPDGLHSRLSITDNGTGIRKENLAVLFEPYFTTKPPEKGTGLGLYVVQRVVRDAGGEVSVESELGKGTTFTIVLPR